MNNNNLTDIPLSPEPMKAVRRAIQDYEEKLQQLKNLEQSTNEKLNKHDDLIVSLVGSELSQQNEYPEWFPENTDSPFSDLKKDLLRKPIELEKKVGRLIFEYNKIRWLMTHILLHPGVVKVWKLCPNEIFDLKDFELMKKFINIIVDQDIFYESVWCPLGLWTKDDDLGIRIGRFENKKLKGELGELKDFRNDIFHLVKMLPIFGMYNGIRLSLSDRLLIPKKIEINLNEKVMECLYRTKKLQVLLHSISGYRFNSQFDPGTNIFLKTREKIGGPVKLGAATWEVCGFLMRRHGEPRERIRDGYEARVFNQIAGKDLDKRTAVFDKYREKYNSKDILSKSDDSVIDYYKIFPELKSDE